MIPLDRLEPSQCLALAALIEATDDEGSAAFESFATRYAEHAQQGDDEGGPRGPLSTHQVVAFLQRSVLPRLEEVGLVESAGNTHVRWTESTWSDIRMHRSTWLERLLEHASQPRTGAPSDVLGPGGSTLEGRGLTKVYRRRRVVDDVDVALQQREIVGLLGPNGAGKTTTFYMLMGIIRPDRGRILIDDGDVTKKPMYRRARLGMGYLSQEPSVFRKLTVEQNLKAVLETLPISAAEQRDRLELLLEELSIKHLRKQHAYQLSGGERRRLEITRALVTDPKFMLLDEPFAGVDPIAVHDIQTIVASLKGRGIGVLITDHNVEQTLDIVDRAYIMFEGKVQVSGTVRELVFNDHVADVYLGPTLTQRLRKHLTEAA